jgi:hypothetical protein
MRRMAKARKKTDIAFNLQGRHLVGAFIVTGMLYLLFPVYSNYYLGATSVSSWIPVWLLVIVSPLLWIPFVVWVIVSRKLLRRFGWSSPGLALIQAIIACLIAMAFLIRGHVATMGEILVCYGIFLILLLLLRNIERKRT